MGSPAGTSCNVSNEGVVSKFVAGNACVALEGFLPFIGQALGQPTIQMFDEVHLIFSAVPDTDPSVEMFTNFWDNDHAKFFSNVQEPCQITVYPIAWSGQADTSLSPDFRVLLAHEVVHCYQNAIVGVENAFTPGPSGRSLPKWISEGSATYIATTLLGIEEPGTPSFWNKGNLGWLGAPNAQLDTRSYDAVGWYSLVSKLTGSDLYGLFPTAWKDYSTDGFNTSKFIKDMGGDATTVMQAWGASLVNEPSWGDVWTTPGFGVPSGPPTETSDTIQSDNVPYHQDVVPLGGLVDSEGAVSDGLVEISTDQGYTSVHDSADHSYLAFTNEVFCLKDACTNKHVVCPGALAPAPLLEVVPPFVVSTAGSEKAAVVTMEHIPAPKSNKGNLVLPSSAGPCKPTPLPPPPKSAFSEGDPHLQALDGAAFDFQGVGEYQLVHNANGQVVVQTRSAPAAGSNSVSWNTAVAMMVGSDRVEVDAASPVVVLLNGVSATFPKSGPLTLKGGGTVTRVPDGDFADVTVTWPDGSRNDIFADARGENSTFTPPATGVDDFTGLLAAPTGAKVPKGAPPGSIALAGGDGKTYVLDPTTKAGFATLYGSFAMSWRVTKTNSLFAYAKGKGVGSYDIAGFPKQLVSLDTLGAAAKAAAETKCKAQGITDPKLLADCELDVAETGATDLAAATPHASSRWRPESLHHKRPQQRTPLPITSQSPARWSTSLI